MEEVANRYAYCEQKNEARHSVFDILGIFLDKSGSNLLIYLMLEIYEF